jgi:hypothetical protein
VENESRIIAPGHVKAPWYLETRVKQGGSRRIIGPILHASTLLMIAYRVLRHWWRSRYLPEHRTNRDVVLQDMFSSVFKLPLWIGGAVIAGVIGAQFATAGSAGNFAHDIDGWAEVIFWSWAVSTFFWWCNLLGRLKRAINQWVERTNNLETAERDELDATLVGYAIPQSVRSELQINSVRVFAPLSFVFIAMILIDLAGH